MSSKAVRPFRRRLNEPSHRAAGDERVLFPPAEIALREPAVVHHSLEGLPVLPRNAPGTSAGETDASVPTDDTPTPGVTSETPSPDAGVTSETPSAETADAGSPDAGAVPAQTPGTPPATPAAPTLTLTPGTTLNRGDTLTATINYTAPTGSTLEVRSWTYTTGRTVVRRPAADATFRTAWSGVMATSGTLNMKYRINTTGANGRVTNGTEVDIPHDITVNDRTGSPWSSSITENAEAALSGKPSPPVVFSDLGEHTTAGSTLPQVTASTIADGPNKGYTFAQSLTAGSYISQPNIHPDLSNTASTFYTFHQASGLLFYTPTGGTRTRQTPAGLTFTISAGATSFSVGNWEAFYKSINIYQIVYRNGRQSYTLIDTDWRLNPNTETGTIELTTSGEANVRAGLGLSPTDGFAAPTVTNRGRLSAYKLLGSARILSGTQSHEYSHATHSHRANYRKMLSALDPQLKAEKLIFRPGASETYQTTISSWWTQIGNGMRSHKLVDESQSRTDERFVDNGTDMAGVNQDTSGTLLGNVWNITGDAVMRN